MATGIPARLTPAEGRKFGLTVGGAFLVITAIIWWRGKHPGAVPFVGGLGGLLVLAGLVVPTLLGPVNQAWMGLAHLMSKVTTPIFMGVVYFAVLTPIAFIMRMLGKNPMVHPPQGNGFWFERGSELPEPSRMERQF